MPRVLNVKHLQVCCHGPLGGRQQGLIAGK